MPAPSTVKGDMPQAGECSIADSYVAFVVLLSYNLRARVQQVRTNLPCMAVPGLGTQASVKVSLVQRLIFGDAALWFVFNAVFIGMLRYGLYLTLI